MVSNIKKLQSFLDNTIDQGFNRNHFVMAINDVRPLGNFDVTTQTVQPAPAAGLNNAM